MAAGSVISSQHPKLKSGSMFGEPSSTIFPCSTPTNLNPPYLTPETLNIDFPCLPSNSNPNLSATPQNPKLYSHKKIPASAPLPSSPNPWKQPPNLRKILTTKKFILRFIPPSSRGSDLIGICPSEAVVGELQILDLTLVGFFLGRKPAFSHIRSSLLKQWKIRGSVQMLQLTQGGLAFRFSDIEDRDKILEIGVYYVSGQPIFFRSWERNIHTGGILGLKQIPLWVSLPGLPLHLWGEDSLSAVCSVLGKPLYSDRITAEKSRWSFARACVEFSAGSPLLDSITIEDDVGNIFQQPVKYDWKPLHCISCGIFGHLHDSCKRGPGEAEQPNEDAYRRTNQTHNSPAEAFPSTANEEENPEIVQGVGKNANRDISILGKGKTFSELLQQRTSMLLRGWKPIRVKKTGSAVQDPTQIRKPLHSRMQNSDLGLPAGHVSLPGVSSSDPSPSCMDKDGQNHPLSSSPILEKNSNFKLAPISTPTLTNRFGILDMDVDNSPCLLPKDMSLSDSALDQALVHQACSKFDSNDPPCEVLSHDVDSSSHLGDMNSGVGLVPGKGDPSVDLYIFKDDNDQSKSGPFFWKKNSKPPGPAPCALPLSNSFTILEVEKDKSTYAQPESHPLSDLSFLHSMGDVSPSDCIPAHLHKSVHDPSVPSSPFPPLANSVSLEVSPLDPSPIHPSNHKLNLQQPLQKITSSESLLCELDLTGLNQSYPLQKKTISRSSKRGLTKTGKLPHSSKSGPGLVSPRPSTIGHTPFPIAAQSKQSTTSPSPGQPLLLNGTESSSAGRTPYHSRFSNRSYFSESNSCWFLPSKSMISMANNGDDPDQMMEPISFFSSADGSTEDVVKHVDEEDIGIEETVVEESEKGKDQLGRDDAVAESAKTQKCSNYGGNSEKWVTTTLNDPRRIKI